jgi:hypothetical protein
VKPIVEKYFVVVKIDVQETKEKQELNTPGGEVWFKRAGGPAGLPFFAFLDAHGNVIVNSMRPGENGKAAENIGHPEAPEEVDWFMAMVRKAVPEMSGEELGKIEGWLRHQGK